MMTPTQQPSVTQADHWQPLIGEEVRCTEAFLAQYPCFRGERYWVTGVRQNMIMNYPKAGLDVTVSDEWPLTSKSNGGTDGFIIHGDGPDDLEPVNRPSTAALRAENERLRGALHDIKDAIDAPFADDWVGGEGEWLTGVAVAIRTALSAQPSIQKPSLEPQMMCAHCGRFEDEARQSGSTHCNAPFDIQPHDFSRPHPYFVKTEKSK